MIRYALAVIVLLLLAPASLRAQSGAYPNVQPALDAIDADGLLQHIKVLSSDEFEGRGPATRGEELTVRYLADQFRALGLQPGNPDGTYFQAVPLVGFTDTSTFSYTAAGKLTNLVYQQDYMANTRRMDPEIKIDNSDVVFVGYGVVAPEYGWDDYKDVDVRGKTIVMLVNDPAIPDPADPAKLDESMFKGKAMTYYGRWTYKYEIASQKGAAAAIVIHETGPAGYPWEVVSGSWHQEQFDIERPDGNAGRVPVEAWVTADAARAMLGAGGQDLDALKRAALARDFKPVPLAVKAGFTIRNQARRVNSRNVVARLEGSDPQLRNEYVIYSAHWDHLGKDDRLAGDPIFNGALDNASGTAMLLEQAQAFTRLNPAPRRSILFLATTSEEKGLLGAKYYAENPLYPLARTAANVNFDGMNQWGLTRDIVVVGMGQTTLEDTLADLARAAGRVVEPDPQPEKGGFYRNDEFEFAKQGIPAIHNSSGTEFIGKPEGWGIAKRDDFTAHDYHKVSDEVKPDWDLSGAVADARLLFQLGYLVAQTPALPQWKPGAEFKAKRDAMMSER